MGSQSQSDASQLNSIIKSFGETPDRTEKLGYLKNLTSQALPSLSLVEVEAQFFSRILPKVYDAVYEAILEIEQIIKSLQAQAVDQERSHDRLQTVQSLLQLVMAFMEWLETCVGNVTQLSLTEELFIEHIHSLPSAVLQTVNATFKHCKDSEKVYGDLFHVVSQDLAMLFKRSYQLQKGLMELLDKVQLNYDASDEDVRDITEVCHQLLEVCILIGDLDTSILVNTWKVLKKLVTKHRDHIKNYLEVDRLICHLCTSIETKLMQCVQLAPFRAEDTGSSDGQKVTGDEVALAKMLKIMRFLVGHLVHLTKEYDGYYDTCLENIFHFLLMIQSTLPPSLSAPKIDASAVQGIKSALLIVVEPLLSVIVKNKHFAKLITRKSLVVDDKSHFAHCCLLVTILSVLPSTPEDVFAYWISPTNYPEEECRHSLLEAVFQYFSQCVVEVSLPLCVEGVMSKGKPLREVTLYEHVCTRMCSLVASTPAVCFSAMERCLLEHILQDDLLCALLSSDVWCFMARWGSAELCSGHVIVLTQLISQLPASSAGYVHLSLLIQRLTRLMAVEHQENLAVSFPPSKEENIAAWCIYPLRDMPESVKKKVCRSLFPLCVQVCHSRIANQSAEDNELMSRCLRCLRRVYSLPKTEGYVPPVHHSATIGLINDLWSLCCQGSEQVERFRIHMWCELLDLTSALLPLIQPEDYATILIGLRSLLDKKPTVGVRQAAAEFLGRCGSKEIPEHLESAVLSDISVMFSALVSDTHWLVHQQAFQSVKAFAEVTRYTHVMGDCVPENLLPSLSDFLNQLPYRHSELGVGDMTEFDVEFLRQQLGTEAWSKTQITPSNDIQETEIPFMDTRGRLRNDSANENKEIEPEPKRLKTQHDLPSESQGEALYNEAIQKLKIPVSTILDLRKQFAPSAKVVENVEEIQTLLQKFLSGSAAK
ncbi:unnamed protein product [Pocillopora meandrina]|uniref:Uncharacterized protein n=1 Tax=Pocillopora meandrina TaxID=46732 RepID=A0AAU9VNG7_9CNID|nr:unnamed protein product [Pocillopora meandrina]